MTINSKLDDISWHIESVSPSIPISRRADYAGAHIALFLNWLIDADALTGDVEELLSNEILLVKSKKMNCWDLLEKMDGKLSFVDIDLDFFHFVNLYYTGSEKCSYFNDWQKVIGDNTYRIAPENINYTILKEKIDNQFHKWRSQKV